MSGGCGRAPPAGHLTLDAIDRPAAARSRSRTRRCGTRRTADVTAPFELPVLRSDGTVALFEARLNHFDSPHGQFAGAVAIVVPNTPDRRTA